MGIEERIALVSCGCHVDKPTGLVTQFCAAHDRRKPHKPPLRVTVEKTNMGFAVSLCRNGRGITVRQYSQREFVSGWPEAEHAALHFAAELQDLVK